MNIVIVGNGPIEELPDLSAWSDATFIGVDAGTMVLLEQGISPKEVVGDFDSVTKEQLEAIASLFPDFQKVAEEKDETDTELALAKAMEYHPQNVILTGVTGGRLDHYMSALHAMYHVHIKYAETAFYIVNKQNRIRFLSPGKHTIKRSSDYRFISFYPFGEEVKGLTLRHFKYPVMDETIPFGSTRFVSNEFETEGIITIKSGSCIVIESADKAKA